MKTFLTIIFSWQWLIFLGILNAAFGLLSDGWVNSANWFVAGLCIAEGISTMIDQNTHYKRGGVYIKRFDFDKHGYTEERRIIYPSGTVGPWIPIDDSDKNKQ